MINQFGLKIALPLLTACLTTLFAPSIWGKSLGLVSIGAAGSYAVCTSLSETKRKAINEKIAQQKAFVLERVVKLTEAQQELTDTKTLLSTKEAELTELLEKTKDFDQITSRLGVVELELSELSKDYEEKKDEVLTLRHDLTNFENGSYAAELREQWEVEYADKLAIFQTREAKSKYNRLQVRKLLEERDQLINELEVELEEALNNSKALVSEFTEVKKEADVTFESLGGQASSIYQQAQVELAEKVGEIKHLQDRIKELESTLSAPKRFNRVGQDAVIGNKVIDFLMSNGICMDAEDVERQFNTLNVWLSPR
jgi:chromosome segregation ATPase